MTKLNKSPDKFNSWKGKTAITETGEEIDLFQTFADEKSSREEDPEWQKNNLEYDLRTNEYIINKVRASRQYGQKLYAALCNNEFIKREMWQLLKEETWSCSWRYAGGILADMLEEGDYMDWYCSGNEGVVDPEVQNDLYNLDWIVVNTDNGDKT